MDIVSPYALPAIYLLVTAGAIMLINARAVQSMMKRHMVLLYGDMGKQASQGLGLSTMYWGGAAFVLFPSFIAWKYIVLPLQTQTVDHRPHAAVAAILFTLGAVVTGLLVRAILRRSAEPDKSRPAGAVIALSLALAACVIPAFWLTLPGS